MSNYRCTEEFKMKTLIDEAREKKLWLKCELYDDELFHDNPHFSPDELKAHRAAGRHRLGPEHWVLIDPNHRLRQLRERVIIANDEADAFEERMKQSNT